ncbi:MAG: methionyl-tRNA formyltransferase, partial [Spirochaetaceae bacterium]|nr:methionyl-tRNA formyltransferase [Spirochaetaceae bacterium]
MRVLFAGSPEIALPSLEALAAEGLVAGVLTNPDAQRGRGLGAAPTPVALAAERLGLPVLKPERLGAEAREAAAALKAELLVSFAYGRIFGPKFLALFPRGGLNVHPSLLPKYRGCAPIPAAILHRDAETGVAVQRLALAMDEGELLAVERLPLSGRETTESLSALAATVGAGLLLRVVRELEEGRESGRPQEGEASYCSLLAKEDGLLHWDESALDLDARVRAFHPWPGAFTWLKGQRLTILESEAYPGEVWAGPPPPAGGQT